MASSAAAVPCKPWPRSFAFRWMDKEEALRIGVAAGVVESRLPPCGVLQRFANSSEGDSAQQRSGAEQWMVVVRALVLLVVVAVNLAKAGGKEEEAVSAQ